MGGASLAVLNPLPILEDEGWRFTFWAPRPSPIAELLETRGYSVAGVPRHLRYSRAAWREPPGIWTRTRSVPGYLRRFRQFVQAADADVVHVNTIVALPEALVARSTGAPTLLNVHEMLLGTQGTMAARMARLVDGVATVSNACAAPLLAGGATVHIVTPCVPSLPELRQSEARERLVVGTLATISERKGSDVFVAMACAILARRHDVEFRMVGTVPTGADERWARDVVERGERHGVRWSVTSNPVAELLDWDIFVLPTRRDPFPLAVLEAMAAGLPVVASAVDGVCEQVDEASAILVAPDDVDAATRAVERLLDDKSLRASMGQRGVERVGRCFTPERQATELISAYDNVLRARERRRRGRRA